MPCLKCTSQLLVFLLVGVDFDNNACHVCHVFRLCYVWHVYHVCYVLMYAICYVLMYAIYPLYVAYLYVLYKCK